MNLKLDLKIVSDNLLYHELQELVLFKLKEYGSNIDIDTFCKELKAEKVISEVEEFVRTSDFIEHCINIYNNDKFLKVKGDIDKYNSFLSEVNLIELDCKASKRLKEIMKTHKEGTLFHFDNIQDEIIYEKFPELR